MPRRELLTPTERGQLFAFPEDEGELIRLAPLARADVTYIRQHRGDHNRLGLAIQMVYLRHPSRVLPQNEAPFPPLLGIVTAQLSVTPAVWTQYARRDETRREHLQELLDRFELRQFNRTDFRALIEWPFYTKVINANVRDATHVLDGLLYHESQLRIEEHYTDTAGFTDQVFALCHMLGFQFAPRIADLADKRLLCPKQTRRLAESCAVDRNSGPVTISPRTTTTEFAEQF